MPLLDKIPAALYHFMLTTGWLI